MYIIRPKWCNNTPRSLAMELHTETRRVPSRLKRFRPDWHRDFFLVYPDGVQNADDTYKMLQSFFWKHKGAQRRALGDMGLPVPETMPAREGQKYVIRPLHHHGGRGFRVSERCDPGVEEYAAPLFPKTHEYRIILVRGKPTIFLRKHPGEGVGPDQPWNADVAPFKTVNDWKGSRLQKHTDVFEKLAANPVSKNAHIVAADILFNKKDHSYVICEFNTCPGLDIDNNRRKIAEAIRV